MIALLLGRFHAVTRAQAEWLASLARAPVDRLVCVITSADHAGTRRNPLSLEQRRAQVEPALAASGKPFDVVPIADIPDSAAWVDHVCQQVQAACGQVLAPGTTQVYSANRDVDALFRARGFSVVAGEVQGLTPHELVQRVVEGGDWESAASEATKGVFHQPGVIAKLKQLFGEKLVTDDGELGHQRDFQSYGAQMDASLQQKLTELARWVKPGCIVDKGCGTGRLMVELSRLFPDSKLVGVDLSREFLRRCDENTYATQDVELVAGNVVERSVPAGSATSVVYSSVMHEVYSYSGYRVEEIFRALSNTHEELAPGGHVLIRDGVSPPQARWRLELLTPEVRATFERFVREFKHGQGVGFERVSESVVRLSAHDANEFLCKKDYLKNWHIEVHEEYGVLTLEGWRAALHDAGFEPLYLAQTVNPWIVEHRYQGQVRLRDDAGAELPWPATNAVIIGRKPRR
jgi:SAM-dependent methyltransferase